MAARNETQNAAGVAERRAPDRTVRSWRDRIKARVDAMVLRRIDGLIRLRVVAAFAVAICVEDERCPSLRFLFVAGLVEALRVEPADHRSAAARPQCSIGILGEHQMMRAEAGVDVRQLFRFGIVHRELPPGTIEWKEPRRRLS